VRRRKTATHFAFVPIERRSSNAGLGDRQIDLLFVFVCLPFQLPMVLREQSGRP
jgi:hypothetical protein